VSDHASTRTGATVQPAYVNVYSVDKGAALWEQAFVGLWMFIIYLPLEAFSPLRYLCILGFIVILAYDYKRLVPLLVRCWPLFAVAILGLISVGWAPYPTEAFRQGVLLFLSSFVAVVIGVRLTPQQTLRVIMFAGMATTIASIPYFGTFDRGGPYASKNYFAVHMLFCMLLSLITALNEKEPLLLRLMALPFVPVCFVFLYMADSATSLVFAVLGGAGLVAIKFFWSPATKVRGLSMIVIIFAVVVVLIGALAVFNMPQNTFVERFLGLVGKDATLTGRTALWEGARLAAEQKPWLGLGLEGFWYYDSGAAQTLNENDFKAYGTRLTFHNAYWEVRVHLGYIGLALFIYFLIWTSLRLLLLWFKDGSLVNSALLLLVAVNLTMTFTESLLWGMFTAPVLLQALAGIVPFRLHAPKLEGRARLVPAA
jgi:exopolysaccharide production protein ExoQ